MPLEPGYDPKTIGRNIGRELEAGRSREQAAAIAYDKARDSARKARDPHRRAAILRELSRRG